MEIRACCKINLGLRVLRCRADGFRDIETVMVPVRGLYDDLSVRSLDFLSTTPPPYPAPAAIAANSALEVTGDALDCPPEMNICMRALRLLQQEFGIGEALIRLRKRVPTGAGLGGGSADAAAVLISVNEEFAMELSDAELEELGARLGSDVPFFVRALGRGSGKAGGSLKKNSGAQLCTGRGEAMEPVDVDLGGLWLAIAKPSVSVSTAEAYAGVTPSEEGPSLSEILARPVREWREGLVNDFETSVFARHQEIGRLKEALYRAGAVYVSMSGSGSAIYGLFEARPELVANELGGNHIFLHVEQINN